MMASRGLGTPTYPDGLFGGYTCAATAAKAIHGSGRANARPIVSSIPDATGF